MQVAEVCHISGRCFQIYQACGQHAAHRWPTPDSGAVFESPLERGRGNRRSRDMMQKNREDQQGSVRISKEVETSYWSILSHCFNSKSLYKETQFQEKNQLWHAMAVFWAAM